MIPALRLLALDRRLGPRAIRVYGYIAQDLDYRDFRPVKVYAVARGLGIHRQNAGRALRFLVRAGYLERDGKDGPGGAWTYRLIYSPRPTDLRMAPSSPS